VRVRRPEAEGEPGSQRCGHAGGCLYGGGCCNRGSGVSVRGGRLRRDVARIAGVTGVMQSSAAGPVLKSASGR